MTDVQPDDRSNWTDQQWIIEAKSQRIMQLNAQLDDAVATILKLDARLRSMAGQIVQPEPPSD